MLKRLKWLFIGYVIGVFTFDILKRYLEERYGDTKAYATFTSALASVSDFQNRRNDLDDYINAN